MDAVVIPLAIGFLTAFYLPPHVFTQFLIVLLIYKALTISNSLKNFHYHSIGSKRNIALLIIVYIAYIGVVIEMLRTSYSWTKPFVLAGSGLAFGQHLRHLYLEKSLLKDSCLLWSLPYLQIILPTGRFARKNVSRN